MDKQIHRSEGIVDILNSSEKPAHLFKQTTKLFENDYESMTARKESTPLSKKFFSASNVDVIQDNIRYNVYKKVDRIIGRQSAIDLHILMTSIHDEYSTNDCNNMNKSIKALNNRVIEHAVRIIVTNLKQYLIYLVDKSSFPTPIDRPTNESIKGRNTFERYPY